MPALGSRLCIVIAIGTLNQSFVRVDQTPTVTARRRGLSCAKGDDGTERNLHRCLAFCCCFGEDLSKDLMFLNSAVVKNDGEKNASFMAYLCLENVRQLHHRCCLKSTISNRTYLQISIFSNTGQLLVAHYLWYDVFPLWWNQRQQFPLFSIEI